MLTIVLIILAAGIIITFAYVILIAGPETEEQKNQLYQKEAEYIAGNNITVTAEYSYENEYFANIVSWPDAIYYKYIVDDENKKIHILGKDNERIEILFSEIIGCEVFSDSQTVGGIKRAIVGAALAGDTGALVGTMTAKPHIMSYKIVIYQSDIQCPTIELVLIKAKKSTKDKDYVSAVDFSRKILASIKAIMYQSSVS